MLITRDKKKVWTEKKRIINMKKKRKTLAHRKKQKKKCKMHQIGPPNALTLPPLWLSFPNKKSKRSPVPRIF